jgi:hypothetical protein
VKLLIALLVVTGCANDVRVRYPSAPTDPTGTLVLTMASAASGVSVAINGVLVVDDAHTKHIVVEGVPTGTGEVIMAANGSDKAFRVWIDSSHPTTVPLGVPDEGSSFVKSLAGSLLTVIVYTLIH